MEIGNTYLMWVGSDNYPTIEDWVKEAEKQGVSKRIPNAYVGAKLKEPGTIIFVAHDEGEWKDCQECFGEIENPEWRKKQEKVKKFLEEISTFEKERDLLTDSLVTEETEEMRKRCDKINLLISRREEKIKSIVEDVKDVEERIDGGTGGVVKLLAFTPEGYKEEIIDYRKYDYYHHQPDKFSERWMEINIEPKICKTCGGKGKLPEAKIFGLFVPSCVEYVMKKEDSEEVGNEIRDRGFKTVPLNIVKTEEKRKCGGRKEGGYYVVTDKEEIGERTNKVVEELISRGVVKPEGIDIKGDFIHFLYPIPVEEKRFRGIKKWGIEEGSEIKESAEMIMDALE
jgi:hypothetical protein